jgi:hypothetical protein
MSIKLTAVIRKESKIDPRHPTKKDYYASLELFSEDGEEYGVCRYLSGYQEVGDMLAREAGVTYDVLQGHQAAYDKGQEVRIPLTVESEEAIKNLGFDPKAA